MIEIIFAILAAISDGTKDFFNRVVMIKEDPYVYGFIQNVIATLLFIPLFLSVKFPTNNIVYLFILLSALAWVGIAIIGNYSYKYTEVSLRAPISQIRIIILLILSMLFLSEKLTLNKGIGTLLIFIGLFVLRFKGGKFDIKNKGIQLTVLTACLVALAAIFNKIALNYTVPEFQGFLIYLIPTVILFFFLKGRKKAFDKHIDKRRNRWSSDNDDRIEGLLDYSNVLYGFVRQLRDSDPRDTFDDRERELYELFFDEADRRSKDLRKEVERQRESTRKNPLLLGNKLNTDAKIVAAAFVLSYRRDVSILTNDTGIDKLARRIGFSFSELRRSYLASKLKELPPSTIKVLFSDMLVERSYAGPEVYSPITNLVMAMN